jgi:hypothetical protein
MAQENVGVLICAAMWKTKTLLRASALPILATTITWTSAGFVSASAGASTPQLSKATVQNQTAKVLATETGQKRPKVTCPSGLKAKVGATIHCVVVPVGSKLQYPATITVKSVKGTTANFHIQLGQALGQADMAKFCADNLTIDKALLAAKTPSQFLQALVANQATIQDFQNHAPDKIVDTAGTLALAAHQSIKTTNPDAFATKVIQNDIIAVDKFCGQPVP